MITNYETKLKYRLIPKELMNFRAITSSDIKYHGHTKCMISFLSVVLISTQNLSAQNRSVPDEQIMSIVRDEPRMKDILNDFPEIRLVPEYSRKHDIWIVNFIHEDKGEVGLITVEPESYKILEFSFNIDKVLLEEREGVLAESDDYRMEEGLFQLLRSFLPNFNGMTLA